MEDHFNAGDRINYQCMKLCWVFFYIDAHQVTVRQFKKDVDSSHQFRAVTQARTDPQASINTGNWQQSDLQLPLGNTYLTSSIDRF